MVQRSSVLQRVFQSDKERGRRRVEERLHNLSFQEISLPKKLIRSPERVRLPKVPHTKDLFFPLPENLWYGLCKAKAERAIPKPCCDRRASPQLSLCTYL